ncbi:hypothetical protein ACHAPT_008542 [Fusarium lateritium]
MGHPIHLLTLPYDLRELIWASSAATGGANGLMRCCRQTRDEFSRHRDMPRDITKLVKLGIWIDSTYTQGSWLKFEYCWKAHGHTYRAVDAVHDLDDPIAQRLLKMTHAEEIVVHLQAPRRGHFVGALLMMLAKVDDTYHLIGDMSKAVDSTDPRNITIRFSTEAVQPGQSKKEAKNFWECRAPMVLEESIRKKIYFYDDCSMPAFYEYFLINHPVTFAHPPKFEFLTWPRIDTHVHFVRRTIPSHVQGLIKEHGPKLVAKNLNLRDESAMYSGEMMTDRRNQDDVDVCTRVHGCWNMTDYGAANLRYRYQFLLDNLVGPVGGCLDMLRLHRFRTMGATEANFFTRDEQVAMNKFSGLAGAASEITNRLKILFNPFASAEIRELRTRCPHLRAVPWATDPSAATSPRQYCPRPAWLEHYPNGIRYNWNGTNLAEWRFTWGTSECQELPGRGIVWLNRWWDCLACCDEGEFAMKGLSLPFEWKVLRNWWEFFHRDPFSPIVPDDLVMVRRECIRQVQARSWGAFEALNPKRMGNFKFGGIDCHCLAEECQGWSKEASRDATFKRNVACRRTCCSNGLRTWRRYQFCF